MMPKNMLNHTKPQMILVATGTLRDRYKAPGRTTISAMT